jgi:hypothetical protein
MTGKDIAGDRRFRAHPRVGLLAIGVAGLMLVLMHDAAWAAAPEPDSYPDSESSAGSGASAGSQTPVCPPVPAAGPPGTLAFGGISYWGENSLIQPYEPLTGGWTKDSDDVGYLDVNLSVKFRLLPVLPDLPHERFFVALSTRFGFYWRTRPGSPVLGKDYNPRLMWRFMSTDDPSAAGKYMEYLDASYAHESNGQPIHTLRQYSAVYSALPNRELVDDLIHRGWNYLDVTWKKKYLDSDLTSVVDAKYFIPVSLFRARLDEYHAWEENPQGKPRRAVDGLDGELQYPSSHVDSPIDPGERFGRTSITIKYQTGYDTPFRYSTVRAEFGFQAMALPLAIWMQQGYMSDLAMYYQKVTSYGMEVRFVPF